MFVLSILLIAEALAIDDNGICMTNHTVLEIPGDAILTVFLDVHFGPLCNESTPKAFEEVTTALHVVATLNKNHYVPGMSLGLKVIDTCQDSISIYKRSLMLAAELNCLNQNYSLGVLAPESYIPVLQPLQEFTDLPVTYFFNENTTKPLVNIVVDFVSKRFQAIDLFLTDSDATLDLFVNGTKDAGLCVKSLNNVERLQDDMESLIVIAAREEYIRSWIEQGSDGKKRKTWIILPLDDSEIDDILPVGSYLITPEFLFFDEKSIENEDLEVAGATAIHLPYLLSIGKALIPIANLLSSLQKQNCQAGMCSLPIFDSKLLQGISNTQVFEALRIPPQQKTINYTVFKRTEPKVDELEAISAYEVDFASFLVKSKDSKRKLNLCRDKTTLCRDCVNLWKQEESSVNTSGPNLDVKPSEKPYLKSSLWVLVFLILIACGTIVCLAIGGYILFRFIVNDVLDGNPLLTFLLILGNILMLHSVIPFCLDEDILGSEHLNSRKIFVSTLSIGFVLSIMLSRSFFLALSTGGVFTSHINGYLQGLMVFFMFGVQLGLSTMYLIVSPANSADVLHSSTFIALLSYDIFLLVTLLGVCSLISNIPRNYHEGKCFFFTVLSLLAVWLVWITTFLSAGPNWRDIIVSAGLIITAYVIIVGVLLPRIYYMVTHLDREKDFKGHFESTDLSVEQRRKSLRQSRRPFYDYVLPMEGVTNTSGLREPSNPNFYGGSSPSHRRQQSSGNIPSHLGTKFSGFNNYGYHPDMQETDSHYVVPKVYVDNPNGKRRAPGKPINDPNYAQPEYSSQVQDAVCDNECIETEIYVEGTRLSPSRKQGPNESYPSRCSSPRLYRTEATIDEEDEEIDDHQVTKITRF